MPGVMYYKTAAGVVVPIGGPQAITEGTTIPANHQPGTLFWDTDAIVDWSGNTAQNEFHAWRTTNWTLPLNTWGQIPWQSNTAGGSWAALANSNTEIHVYEPGTYLAIAQVNTQQTSGAACAIGSYVIGHLDFSDNGAAFAGMGECINHQSGEWMQNIAVGTVSSAVASVGVPLKFRLYLNNFGGHASTAAAATDVMRSFLRIVKISGSRGQAGLPGVAQGVVSFHYGGNVIGGAANTWFLVNTLPAVQTIAGQRYKVGWHCRALPNGANFNYRVGSTFNAGNPDVGGIFIDWYVNANSGVGYSTAYVEEFFYGDGLIKNHTVWVQVNAATPTVYAANAFIEHVGPY